MSEQKWYAGSGKEKQGRYGPFLDITLDLDELGAAFLQGFGWETQQGKKKIRINISQKQQVDQYGNSHAVTINTWRPDNQGGGYQGGGQQQGGYNQGGQNYNQYNSGPIRPASQAQGGYGNQQGGYNQGGHGAPQQGGPGYRQGHGDQSHPGSQQPRNQGYNAQQNQNGDEYYTPPNQPVGEYEDDIPF